MGEGMISSAGVKGGVKKFPAIVAHRGFSGKFPENTVVAVTAAVKLGVEFVEIDVHQTRDGEIVVFHDFGLRRMCGIDKRVREATFAELRRMKRDVPTLAEVLQVCRGKVQVLLEIKKADAGKVAAIVEAGGMAKRTVLMTGSTRMLRWCAEEYPRIRRCGLVRSDLATARKKFAAAGVMGLAVDRTLLRSRADVSGVRSRGWAVFAWTVNRSAEMRRLVSLGVDGLITDFPDRAVAMRSGEH